MSHSPTSPPKALTIAGSDSGGGAGMQADLKTFMAQRVYGTSVVTALTAQNSLGASAIHAAPGEFILKQFESVMTDIGTDAAKTGMLANAEIIDAVARALERWPIERLVVDPVMVATSGDLLLEPEAIGLLRRRIIPRAALLTPNLQEAEALTGRTLPVGGEGDAEIGAQIEACARELMEMGARAVLIKGGHLIGCDHSNDYLLTAEGFRVIEGRRIDSPNTHGSGCTLSAAITARLAWGESLEEAVTKSKCYVTECLRHSYAVGAGPGPLNHGWSVGG